MIWTVYLLYTAGACNALLNASHKEIAVTKTYAIAALFNVILNMFMIPILSYNGAAITTVLSDVLIMIIQMYTIYRLGHRPKKKLYYDLFKIILGSFIMGITLNYLNINMWLGLLIGIPIYFIIIYISRVFDNDDKYVIKEILGKN